jgi:hypothetical protein
MPFRRQEVMGTNRKTQNRTDRTAVLVNLIDGLNKHASVLTSLVISGTALQTTDIIQKLQALVTTAQAVDTTRAAWRSAVAADKTDRDQQQTFIAGVQKAVRVAFGNRVDTLADFGLPQPKARTPLTPEQKQAAAAKAKATRAARHTMGAKQKAAITGEMVATTPAPGGANPPGAGGAATQAPGVATTPTAPVQTAPNAPTNPAGSATKQ